MKLPRLHCKCCLPGQIGVYLRCSSGKVLNIIAMSGVTWMWAISNLAIVDRSMFSSSHDTSSAVLLDLLQPADESTMILQNVYNHIPQVRSAWSDSAEVVKVNHLKMNHHKTKPYSIIISEFLLHMMYDRTHM
jgi:hypothetical protein